jgi:toxin HigB-1
LIRSFFDQGSEDVFQREDTKHSRKTLPQALHRIAVRKLDMLNAAAKLIDLRIPPGNQLEALKGDRGGQHSIRINDQFRICFVWSDNGAERVEITDYH